MIPVYNMLQYNIFFDTTDINGFIVIETLSQSHYTQLQLHICAFSPS